MFAPLKRKLPRRKRAEVLKNLDLSYYGYLNKDEESKLLLNEHKLTMKLKKKALKEWIEKNGDNNDNDSDGDSSDPDYVFDFETKTKSKTDEKQEE